MKLQLIHIIFLEDSFKYYHTHYSNKINYYMIILNNYNIYLNDVTTIKYFYNL